MPILDIVVSLKGNVYKSMSFDKCLRDLKWRRNELFAVELFTGLCNNGIYCPTLSVERDSLKMVWDSDYHSLTIVLSNEIRYALCEMGKPTSLKRVTMDDCYTLIEYWATFINQGYKKVK